MSTAKARISVLSVVLVAAFLLAGCPAPVPPTPTVIPASPTPTRVPATPTPAGWAEHTSGDVTIWLPADWDVLAFSEGDLESIFAEFQKTNPEMAKVIGSADALQDVTLWAFNQANGDAVFADNLNIRRSPLGGQKITKMEDIMPAISDQYRQLGFELGLTETNRQIGGYPAAHIAYSYPVSLADGTNTRLNGHQYLVATPTELWVLSYSAAPGNEDKMKPIFEQSAQSFRVKSTG